MESGGYWDGSLKNEGSGCCVVVKAVDREEGVSTSVLLVMGHGPCGSQGGVGNCGIYRQPSMKITFKSVLIVECHVSSSHDVVDDSHHGSSTSARMTVFRVKQPLPSGAKHIFRTNFAPERRMTEQGNMGKIHTVWIITKTKQNGNCTTIQLGTAPRDGKEETH